MKLKPMEMRGKTAVIEKYLELSEKSYEVLIGRSDDESIPVEFTDYCIEHKVEIDNYWEINREAVRNNIAYNMQRIEEAGLM